MTTRPIRVASVPAGHPYVAHLTSDQPAPADRLGTGVVRLPDPLPDGAAPGQWWPPVVLDAGWIREHRGDFDLLHVHFGTESFSTEHLAGVVDALHEVGRPLVFTVHDLENPQLVEQDAHVRHLDLLIPSADALITLTPGAADEIRQRWDRTATVIPHPDILPLDVPIPDGTPSEQIVVGLHLRDLRPNVDAVGATRTLLAAIAALREPMSGSALDVVPRIDLNDRVRDEDARGRVATLVAASPFATLHEHPRLSDSDLAASLADLDVAVLPYRHGTHSGWVELCFDLGVSVAGPPVGYAAEQHPESFARFDGFAEGDAESLAAAIRTLVQDSAARPGTAARRALTAARREARRLQRLEVEQAHAEVYARALSAVAVA